MRNAVIPQTQNTAYMARKVVMKLTLAMLSIILGILAAGNAAFGQGTLNVALQQQFSFTGCSTAANVCGTPLIGGLLYFYQVGTTATRQDSFADPQSAAAGSGNVNPWPLTLDANGRVPMFYLASGSVHVRLTDASGVVQFDYPSMLVIGPSGTSSGTTYTPPPGSQAATGDIKFRFTKEIPAGWLILNGLTIGNTSSGATQTNINFHDLYVYLYINCPDSVCTVLPAPRSGTSTANAETDWAGSGGIGQKMLTLPDMRARSPVGFDDMGNSPVGFLVSANFANVAFHPIGVDGVTLFNRGGETLHNLTTGELPAYALSATTTITDTRTWAASGSASAGSSNVALSGAGGTNAPVVVTGGSISAATAVNSLGGNLGHNLMPPFVLGTWLIKQ